MAIFAAGGEEDDLSMIEERRQTAAMRGGPDGAAALTLPGGTTRRLLLIGISLAIIAFSVVNFWVYRALAVYAAENPDLVAVRPVTVSRAITEPAVSDAFAAWITFAAVILPFGVGIVARLHVAVERQLGHAVRGLAAWGMAATVAQVGASVGMVILSHYRFPDHDEMHMLGSYIFFPCQAAVILFGWRAGFLLRGVALGPDSVLTRHGIGLRHWLGAGVVLLSLSYLALFVVKDWQLGAWEAAVYSAYTTAEPLLISSFLVFYLTYVLDMAQALRRI